MRRLPLRSPPRMRGKVPVCCPEHRKVRITPAYAGKSSCSRPGSLSSRDHPRVCGEKRKTGAVPAPLPGSPPRVRGKVISSLQCDFLSGITPAYAGKRFAASFVRRCTRDHPRVCGEKHVFAGRYIYFVGSPPRMRGKDLLPALCGVVPGITPAYAGKSTFLPVDISTS